MKSLNLNFEQGTQVEQTIVLLANRDLSFRGMIHAQNLAIKGNMASASEIAFEVHKYENGQLSPLWDDLVDLQLAYLLDHEAYFEIAVQIDEADETIKHVTGKSMGPSELGQIMLYDLEVNTEVDIAREEYTKASVFFDPSSPENSFLHRVFEKAPHYKIIHVDDRLQRLIRSFSTNDQSIYDFLMGNVASEIGCLFEFGDTERTVSVYDLENYCKDCGERIGQSTTCPYCGSQNIDYGYGEDTTILISASNLGESLSRTGSGDSIKNCFRIEAGDDLMTATLANINPNGTQYIHYYSDFQKVRMPVELATKLNAYDELYLSQMAPYAKLNEQWYDLIDERAKKQTTMMPPTTTTTTTASNELAKLTPINLSPVAVSSFETASLTTVNNAIKAYAKVYVSGTYKIEIVSSSYTAPTWTGRLKLTSYADSEDTATQSSSINITVNGDEEAFIRQRIEKALAQVNVSDNNYNWTLYSLDELSKFENAYQGVLDALIEMGVSETSHECYNSIYLPYYEKLQAIRQEMTVRESEIAAIDQQLDAVEAEKRAINDKLNIQKYLGDDLWETLYAYRREQTYRNTNYISEGLTNAEVIEKAEELFKVAQKELITASTLQYSLSCSMSNLLVREEFRPLWNKFKLGNWLRMEIDDEIHRMRLISFQMTYPDVQTLSVEFSDVIQTADGITDVQSILNQTQSMATSYEYVAKQATTGTAAHNYLRDWFQNGLDATAVRVVNNAENQSVVIDAHGLLNRRYDDETGSYSPEQTKLLNSGVYTTSDGWKSTETAIGRIVYQDPNTGEYKEAYGVNARVLVGHMIMGETLRIANANGSMTIDENGFQVSNGMNAFVVNPSSRNMVQIQKMVDGQMIPQMYIDADGYLHFADGTIIGAGTQINGSTINNPTINNPNIVGGSLEGNTLINFDTVMVPVTDEFGNVTYVPYIKQLDINVANIIELNAQSAIIDALNAKYIDAGVINGDIANIENIMAGNMGVGDVQVINLTASNVTISDAVIQDLISNRIHTVNLQAGSINTNQFIIYSDDGNKGLKILGNTIQMYDANGNVGIQLGYDASGHPSLILCDERGNIMLDSKGLHDSIVPDEFIKTEMVADDAITSNKIPWIDIAGEEDENGNPIWSAASVHMDGESLEVKFNETTEIIAASSCTPLFEDCDFLEGFNSVLPYNTTSGATLTETDDALTQGNVKIQRMHTKVDAYITQEGDEELFDVPTRSEYALRITTSGNAAPNRGGFQQAFEARPNATYVIKYIAKLPGECSLVAHNTGIGTGGTDEWTTPTEGTGLWTEYIRVIKCGSDGTFGKVGYVSVSSPAPYTASNPLIWYVAYIRAVDTAYEANITSAIQSAQISTKDEILNEVTQKTTINVTDEDGNVIQTQLSDYVAQQSVSLNGINSTIEEMTTYYEYDENGNPIPYKMVNLGTQIQQLSTSYTIRFNEVVTTMNEGFSNIESYIRFGSGAVGSPQIQLGKIEMDDSGTSAGSNVLLNLNNDEIWMESRDGTKLSWWDTTSFHSTSGVFEDMVNVKQKLQVGNYMWVAGSTSSGDTLTLMHVQ